MSDRSRMLKRMENPVVYEGGILDDTTITRKDTEIIERMNIQNHEVTMKLLESVPEGLNIIKEIVAIHKIKVSTSAELETTKLKIDEIRAKTDDFVQSEMERRKTKREKFEFSERLLRELFSAINHGEASDDVKKHMIEAFNTTIKTSIKEN